MTTGPIAEGMRRRRSQPSVNGDAPTKRELLPLIEAAASVADHASLRPGRIIALRGDARTRFGAAIAEATGLEGGAAEKMAQKPLRAPLLLAVVVSPKISSSPWRRATPMTINAAFRPAWRVMASAAAALERMAVSISTP